MTAASITEGLAEPGWVSGPVWGSFAYGQGRWEQRRRAEQPRPSLDGTPWDDAADNDPDPGAIRSPSRSGVDG
jgi:hypothetical protein